MSWIASQARNDSKQKINNKTTSWNHPPSSLTFSPTQPQELLRICSSGSQSRSGHTSRHRVYSSLGYSAECISSWISSVGYHSDLLSTIIRSGMSCSYRVLHRLYFMHSDSPCSHSSRVILGVMWPICGSGFLSSQWCSELLQAIFVW